MSLRRAMIFAAGRGERMRPLTDSTPKPLLEVGGKRVIEWHLEKLARIGIRYVVINTSHLPRQFPSILGDGRRWKLNLHFLDEGPQPLETGGGMLNALPILGTEPFVLINGDVWTDLDLGSLPAEPRGMAHLILVANPDHRAQGDFALGADGMVQDQGEQRLTYSGIGVYRPSLFDNWRASFNGHAGSAESPPRFPLAPLLRTAMRSAQVSGSFHAGRWVDVGTPQRLHELDAELRDR